MCGIAGIFGVEGLSEPRIILERMNDALSHRGPDAEGTYLDDLVALGHRRLSIIDLSNEANQPFYSSDKRYVLVFNGELYNFQDLKHQLPDYDFKTNSDTEVLLAAFIKWGTASFQLLNGMFAFALYDTIDHKMWLVRDRVGIKPLYYAEQDTTIVFSSEIRSILKSGLVNRTLNKSVLYEYLQYQCVHAPRTLVKNVKMLEAGAFLELSDSGITHETYWKPWISEHSDTDEIRVKKNIRDLLTKSVERRLVADVPLGAFLSGGIDSSLIVGIASERLGKSIDTFNVAFAEAEFSEAKYARLVAKRFNTNHHEIQLNPSDFLNALPEALSSIEHASGDGPNSWIVSRETKKQGITVAISGLGGDELFAGYDVFKQIPSIADRSWLLSFPKFMRRLIGSAVQQRMGVSRGGKFKEILTADYFDLEHLYPIFRKVLLDRQANALLNNPIAHNGVAALISDLEQYPAFERLPVLSRISVAEMNSYMQNVLLRDTDQMSMAHALEVRVPFLDHELVEYCMHIPDKLKFPHSPKALLVNSFKDLLPEEVIHREKMGFVLPWEAWMKNELKPFCEERLEILAQLEAFQSESVFKLWQLFLSEQISWSRVWPLVVLGDWIKQNEIEA
ncbi:MAG: asparagine synthase (glutamine-hydrolyzing) [Salibacteraceae bacterium]